jgi:predicted Fe-S protein YdhL (DUF1289 family)
MAKSPCIKVCQLHTVEGLAYCAGCYRTPEEIQYWTQFEDHVQEYINEQCHNRRHNIHESMGFYKKNKKRD